MTEWSHRPRSWTPTRTLAAIAVTALAAAVSAGVPLAPALGASLGCVVVASLALAAGR